MKTLSSKPRIGLVGYGYWGPNLLRNLVSHGGCEVVAVVEPNGDARGKATKLYPHVPGFAGLDEALKTAKPDAMLIATPPATHKDLAIQCLEAGCHVLVEKPLAMSDQECEEILAVAERKGLSVMVDHTFAYNPCVQYLSEQINTGNLGDLMFYDSVRVNLGGFQARTNVLWDLAPHDISILDLFTGGKVPDAVTCVGMKHFDADVENICYLHLTYSNKFVAHLNANWVAPIKIRTVMIGGTKKMAVYDENNPSERVKVYDKGISLQHTSPTARDFRVSYRMGDMTAPALSQREALAGMIATFVDTITQGVKSVSDGQSGRRVVQILEAASISMAAGGKPIELSQITAPKRKLRRVA